MTINNIPQINSSGWEFKKVKDVATINEENISSSDSFLEIDYIEISNVNKGDISEITTIQFDEAPSRARRKVKTDDILLSTVRPNLEHYAYIKESKENTIASTGFAVITAKNIVPRYLYYVLSSPNYTEYFSMIAAGHTSAYPAMNPDIIENVEIPVPPLQEQKRIAHILGTLDDKIELNRRMNETLESIARAVFKSWFVDFDPVRAKVAGEPYPLPDEVMALFPDELVESELGLIPKGWEVNNLEDIAIITDCLHSKKPERIQNGHILLQVYNIGFNGKLDLSDRYNISESDYSNWIRRFEASPGDIIISKTGRVGAVAQIPKSFRAALGRNLVGIRAKKQKINGEFLRDLMFSQFMENEIIRKTSLGTILKSIHVKHISQLRSIKPNKKVINVYRDYVKSIHSKININIKQNRILSEHRNALLINYFSKSLKSICGDHNEK